MGKLKEKWRIFNLLMYKNLLVRRRHWKAAIFVQTLLPIFLFLLVQAIRDTSAGPPTPVLNDTYHSIISMDYLVRDVSKDIYIYYVPLDESTATIMNDTRRCLKLSPEKIIGFQTETEALEAYSLMQNVDSTNHILMVVFENDVSSSKFKYSIRTQRPMPSTLYFGLGVQEILTPGLFMLDTPFVQMQYCLDKSFIGKTVKNELFTSDKFFTDSKFFIQQMPSPPHIEMDFGDVAVRQFFCSIATVAFLIPLCIEANFAASEKFIGVNVLMAMNGVSTCKNLLSWLISGVLFSFSYTAPIILLFKHSFSSNVYPFLYYSNGFLIWIVFVLHVMHLISFGMHIASYFSKPLFMISGILVAYFCSTLVIKYTTWANFSTITPYFGIFFPNILLFIAFEEVNDYEGKLMGIHWKNIFTVGDATYSKAGSVGMIMVFSILGTLLHFYMAVYIYAVKPGKYGVKKHPLYFLEVFKRNRVSTASRIGRVDYENMDGEPFEPAPSTYIPGIQIRNLKKSYFTNVFSKTSSVQALKGVSIDFYKSHITALLGHNGAGKTTMMSILTGMVSPSEGTVLINGKNTGKDLDKIISDIGLCPQDDMLFPDLNVFQQLLFFGMLKNNDKTKFQITRDVNALMKKLNLLDKRDTLPPKLSGGQKRRVCLGMALIGDANTLILDEPTSGMDPESRRDTWDIILGMRAQKTILISTHNMEEADILGDRIAIIHSGSLRCYGTSMFLKKLYGRGNIEVTLSIEPNCNPDAVRNALNPRGELINVDGGRLVLSIPYSEDLPDALDGVEAQKKDLGVTGMSVSLITLEQVFLKVTKDIEDTVDCNTPLLDSADRVTGIKLTMQQMTALITKNITYTKKNMSILLLKMILPLIGVVLMMNFNLPDDSETVTRMHLSLYRDPQTFIYAKNKMFVERYNSATKNEGGVSRDVSDEDNLNQALLKFARSDNTTYLNAVIAAAEFNDSSSVLNGNAMYSSTATFGLPISLNLLTNTLLKALTDDSFEIETSTRALPMVHMATTEEETQILAYGRVLIFTSFVFAMVALFVIHSLRESTTGIKHLQLMTGTTPVTYWGTMFIFDLIVFCAAISVIVIGIIFMNTIKGLGLYHFKEIMITILLLLLFAMNILPLVYILSFWKKSVSTVISVLSQVPFCLVIVDLILKLLINLIRPKWLLKLVHVLQKFTFYLLPHISFFNGNVALASTAAQNARCRNMPSYLASNVCKINDVCCDLDCSNGKCKKSFPYFKHFKDDPSLEGSVLYLFFTSFLYFAILMMLEHRVIPKLLVKMKKNNIRSAIESSDEQVKVEKHEVAVEISKIRNQNNRNKLVKDNSENGTDGNFIPSNERDKSLFLVYEISKRYKKLTAVREVSFRVKQRECFGLLGINGAGKSTTFRMLTGEELPNSGSLFLETKDIKTERKAYLSRMGYCPQNSAIIETLNAWDHLQLFALLRGVPKNRVITEVNKWIDKLNLNACAAQPSGTYSGGNKRRLNIAIAMIGNPSLVLLDEPTTGVDPAARRSLWDVISSCQTHGQSIILTSHSMEECEALCNRLVIMVKGELVCIGPSQQLKQKFGAGFDIQIKLRANQTPAAISDVKNELQSRLPCELRDENAGLLAYHVTNDRITWKAMYGAMNILKENHSCIEDFTIISATLEQLFLQFARAAKVSSSFENSRNPV